MCNYNFTIGFISRWLEDDHQCAGDGEKYITSGMWNGFQCAYECRVKTDNERDCKFVVRGHGDRDGDCYREKDELCWKKSLWSDDGSGEDYNIFGVERRRM